MELVGGNGSGSVGSETTDSLVSGFSLAELLAEQVAVRPDAVAVVQDDEVVSYRELASRAAELAGYLRHLGVTADDRIGLFVEPSVELMVGAWGILLAGGAYLPLSPEYPEDRLRYMIEDARVKVIFAQEELAERLAVLAPSGTTIVTPADAAGYAPSSAAPGPHDLAYVIYTSGSTGKPKGVMIEHRSIVSQLRWLAAEYGVDSSKVVLQKTPMSFDAAQWEILAPACGAAVVMGSPGIYRDPERLVETIRAHQVTTVQCVPTLLQALLDTEELSTCTSLTQVFSGGEALTRALATEFVEEMPGCALVNLYGPTECTINSSAHTVDTAALPEGPLTISIGRPVHDTWYAVLDGKRQPVAAGEVGELYIGGVQLARGYLHRPDLTEDRFVEILLSGEAPSRWFKTGDLVSWNFDGTVQFVGRSDNQVKLRGFRVELDEIRLAIEEHDWVKNAAVITKFDQRSGFQNLIACIELNPKEAALMDQGSHGAHHQSKENKLAVRTQLSNPGRREAEEHREAVTLPGMMPNALQRQWVFQRKTYRFFEGGEVTKDDIVALLGRRPATIGSRAVSSLSYEDFGEIMRSFGNCISGERLLPKYAYASPGSLYATQLYVELNGIGDLKPGYYYYHPGDHQLVLMSETAGADEPYVRVHFLGKRSAIEPVYKNNIQEVLEIEAGHMVGLFEEYLPRFGLTLREREYSPAVKPRLDCADDDFYLGTFEFVPHAMTRPDDDLEFYVQTHPGKIADLPAGQYRFHDGQLTRISDEQVLKRHVIAINQHVYDRSSVGITVVARTGTEWLGYLDLGRALQRLQMNEQSLGFMSCGYSSKTGYDLPAAKRITSILAESGRGTGPLYFFVGGKVSEEQQFDRGMREDVVHMKGPTEMIKDDLVNFLPDYMIPNKVVVFDRLPLTANGKIDVKALAASDRTDVDSKDRPFVAPRTNTERRVAVLWKKVMKLETVSTQDDFFASGGNSLLAVRLVNQLNKEFGSTLPLQVLFEAPTVELLARKVGGTAEASSRLVPLEIAGSGEPIYCWPGLGGYTMNLRLLAGSTGLDRPFYGVQAHGINAGEAPYSTIREMAAEDVRMIRELQPEGPYTLWGYSFGARLAFESAYQLEQAGQRVDNLFLIAPGSPKVRARDALAHGSAPVYANKAYLTILFSVFAGTISGPVLEQCLETVTDEDGFVSFISSRLPELDADVVRRIVGIVAQTYEFNYTFRELAERRINAPITVFRARGDDYSFLENSSGFSAQAPTFVDLAADHYTLLKEKDIGELVAAIHAQLDVEDQAA